MALRDSVLSFVFGTFLISALALLTASLISEAMINDLRTRGASPRSYYAIGIGVFTASIVALFVLHSLGVVDIYAVTNGA